MTRSQLIEQVKVKLEEISPFDEPINFIAAAGDADYDKVKPIISYIEESLDKAAWYCLNQLPISLLHDDVAHYDVTATIDYKGVGVIGDITYTDDNDDEQVIFSSIPHLRLVRVKTGVWRREVTAFITSQDPDYLLQDNPYSRGGQSKPCVAYVPEKRQIELYSFPASSRPTTESGTTTATVGLWYINPDTAAEAVASPIEDFIVLKCAQMVYEILGSLEQGQMMMKEFANKLNTVLQ